MHVLGSVHHAEHNCVEVYHLLQLMPEHCLVVVWLMNNITFHDNLHRFLPGHSIGMVCLEAKLKAQLAFQSGCMYLNFSKAYKSPDWE